MSAIFDTLQYTKGAVKVGIPREQAEYQAEQIAKMIDYQLVTKADVMWLEKSFDQKLKELENKLIIRLGGLMIVCSGVIMSVLGFIIKH